MKWYRSKPDEDPRDTRIGELTKELGQQRAATALAEAKHKAANRALAASQTEYNRAVDNHTAIVEGLRQAHAAAVTLIEAERDKALARLTAAETANVDALLDELNEVKRHLKDAEDYAAVLIADKADLRAQLKARDEQEVRT